MVGASLQGVVIGLAIALPVGPVGVLCIRRTLAQGRLIGLLSGFGAAVADALYGAVAGFGITAVSGFMLAHTTVFRLVGGTALATLGGLMLRQPPLRAPRRVSPVAGRIAAFTSTFLLTLANPLTVVAFAAAFSAIGEDHSGPELAALVGGIFVGSSTWWVALSLGAGALRERLGDATLAIMSRLAAMAIAALGVLAIAVEIGHLL
jgi:threonine/homoserine/homoserine lactone efflux protein